MYSNSLTIEIFSGLPLFLSAHSYGVMRKTKRRIHKEEMELHQMKETLKEYDYKEKYGLI